MLCQSINPVVGEHIRPLANPADSNIEPAVTAGYTLYYSEWSKGPIKPPLALLMRHGDTDRGPLDHGCRLDLCTGELHHG